MAEVTSALRRGEAWPHQFHLFGRPEIGLLPACRFYKAIT
jgi:hypothetical protein